MISFYEIDDDYIEYLRKFDKKVLTIKDEDRKHTRKYIGVVISIGEFKYYIPMSSPKETDYQIAGDTKVIKKSIVPIIRIVVKNSDGVKELKGTLRISHMIPVPESELELYDLDNEKDIAYKELVQNEIIFIRKNQEKIKNNANVLYKQKKENDMSAGYVKSALPYIELEKYCLEYAKKIEE